MPLALQVVSEKPEIREWNELVDRHHYLGYRRPIGLHLRYFIVDGQGRRLGALMFCYAVKSLPCRDEWIGWQDQKHKKHLDLVVSNNRFLILPWVQVKNLASKSLSMACRRLADDWCHQHAYRPVLIETFVDAQHFDASCYSRCRRNGGFHRKPQAWQDESSSVAANRVAGAANACKRLQLTLQFRNLALQFQYRTMLFTQLLYFCKQLRLARLRLAIMEFPQIRFATGLHPFNSKYLNHLLRGILSFTPRRCTARYTELLLFVSEFIHNPYTTFYFSCPVPCVQSRLGCHQHHTMQTKLI